jgi:recombinational DNA repair protein (RecF pathway)
MSYVTYTTEALVCGSFDQNTADRSFLLFTKELGMLFAVAKSVREERSLQRPALQDFSRIRVSLVKGKTGWRVGSVEAIANDYARAKDRETRGSVVLLYRLLRRFIRGEEPVEVLYDSVISGLDILLSDLKNRRLVELLIEIEVLTMLGYVDKGAIPPSAKDLDLHQAAEVEDKKLEVQLEMLISKARENSHL